MKKDFLNLIHQVFVSVKKWFKKASRILYHMIFASQKSSDLHECYALLGEEVFSLVKEEKISLEKNPSLKETVEQIEELTRDLRSFEKKIRGIKKSS